MMELLPHRIPARVFSDLAAGDGGSAAVDHLAAAQRSKHILLVRQVIESAHAAGHCQAAAASQAYDLLAAIQVSRRDAVDAVLVHPPVGAWARQTIQLLGDVRTRDAAAPGQLAGLAAAAAIRARADCSVEIPVAGNAVMLPSLGRIAVPAHAVHERVRVEVSGGRAEAAGNGWGVQIPADPSQDLAGWQGLRRLSAAARGKKIQVLIEDLDACRLPGSAHVSERLSRAEADSWQSALREAWEVLASHHEVVADEVAAAVRVFTPMLPPTHGQVSATSRDTFGSIALSAPTDSCSLAVTLAHETQHAKLSALLDVVPMLLPDDGARHYTPWRDDPRPLSGLLQGAYAFLGVASFWQRQRNITGAKSGGATAMRAHTEFVRWRDAVRLVIGILSASGRLTGPGEIFVAGMARTVGSWAGEAVPSDAAERARGAEERHRAQWIAANGPIPTKAAGMT